jgi:hypothetical protein
VASSCMMLTTHLYLQSGLRMCGAIPQLFHVFTTVFIKHKGSSTSFFMQCCKCHSLSTVNMGCQIDRLTVYLNRLFAFTVNSISYKQSISEVKSTFTHIICKTQGCHERTGNFTIICIASSSATFTMIV